MKLIVALCFVAVAVSGAAVPSAVYQYQGGDAQVLQYDNDNIGLGNYRYAFSQSDGISQEQQGQIINEGREDESIAVKGSFSWVAPNGVTYKVTYVADSNGYQPEIEEGPGASPAVVASLLG